MKKTLIALAVIAAAAIAPDQPELPPGTTFDAPDDIADKLIADGSARLADAPANAPAAAAKTARSVKVRVLTDCVHGRCNEVATLPADVAKTAQNAGLVDPDKDAVAYAMSLVDPTKA